MDIIRQSKLISIAITIMVLVLMAIGCSRLDLPSTPVAKRTISERLISPMDLSAWSDSALIISPDNKRVAYADKKGNRWFTVVDGIEGSNYDSVDRAYFSPDSQHVAYAAQLGDKWVMVVDGKESNKYDGIGRPYFSQDSEPVGYRASVTKIAYDAFGHGKPYDNLFVVVDGIEGKHYYGVSDPHFSSDNCM
jgi:hypothetical protein